MGTLCVSLFGCVRVRFDDHPEEMGLTTSLQKLLAYLLLQRYRVHPREALAELLWHDSPQEQARHCLNTALWRLRRQLEPTGVPKGTYLITTSTGEVGFNKESNHYLDIADFEENLNNILGKPENSISAEDAQTLEKVLALYTAELLEGCYEEWALRERERLRYLYLDSLTLLMRYYRERKEYRKSLSFGEKIMQLDPLREEINREMIRLYVECGQRPLAIRQYESWREVLMAELGISPMPETQALYDRILEDSGARNLYDPLNEPASLKQVLRQLRQTSQVLEEASGQFRRAIQLIEHFSRGQK